MGRPTTSYEFWMYGDERDTIPEKGTNEMLDQERKGYIWSPGAHSYVYHPECLPSNTNPHWMQVVPIYIRSDIPRGMSARCAHCGGSLFPRQEEDHDTEEE